MASPAELNMVSPELAPVGWGDNPTGLPSRDNGGVAPHLTGLGYLSGDAVTAHT
jgi:hypothetical protein